MLTDRTGRFQWVDLGGGYGKWWDLVCPSIPTTVTNNITSDCILQDVVIRCNNYSVTVWMTCCMVREQDAYMYKYYTTKQATFPE
jgi:hypothetical protein